MPGGSGGLLGGEPAAFGARGRRHRVGVHPADAPRSGPRDDPRPGRRRRARRADRAGPRPLRRHRDHAVRPLRHRRQPVGADGRRRGHVLGSRALREQIARRRRRPARGAARRPRRSTTAHPRRRASRRSRCRSPTSPPPAPASSCAATSVVRRRRGRLGAGHARVLGRGRPRDRPGARRPLRRGRGLRRAHQPERRRRADRAAASCRASARCSTSSSDYDDQANFQAGTFMDYLLPTAAEVPEIEIHHVETPTDIEINYRGVGEGGMIVAPAGAHERDRGRARPPRRAHHRAAPPADAHPRARGRDHCRRLMAHLDDRAHPHARR